MYRSRLPSHLVAGDSVRTLASCRSGSQSPCASGHRERAQRTVLHRYQRKGLCTNDVETESIRRIDARYGTQNARRCVCATASRVGKHSECILLTTRRLSERKGQMNSSAGLGHHRLYCRYSRRRSFRTKDTSNGASSSHCACARCIL